VDEQPAAVIEWIIAIASSMEEIAEEKRSARGN
jgi:hypothetical protein